MRHRVAAYHDGNLCSSRKYERMLDRPESKTLHQPDQIIVLDDRRMTMIAHHPDVRVIPCSATLGVVADLRDSIVDDPIRLLDIRCGVTFGVRSLVDACERSKDKIGMSPANALDNLR